MEEQNAEAPLCNLAFSQRIKSTMINEAERYKSKISSLLLRPRSTVVPIERKTNGSKYTVDRLERFDEDLLSYLLGIEAQKQLFLVPTSA